MDSEELEEKKTITAAEQQLLSTLGDLSESISFCTSGTRSLILPGLNVEGIGEVALPVSISVARQLIEKANQAPYELVDLVLSFPRRRESSGVGMNTKQNQATPWREFVAHWIPAYAGMTLGIV